MFPYLDFPFFTDALRRGVKIKRVRVRERLREGRCEIFWETSKGRKKTKQDEWMIDKGQYRVRETGLCGGDRVIGNVMGANSIAKVKRIRTARNRERTKRGGGSVGVRERERWRQIEGKLVCGWMREVGEDSNENTFLRVLRGAYTSGG